MNRLFPASLIVLGLLACRAPSTEPQWVSYSFIWVSHAEVQDAETPFNQPGAPRSVPEARALAEDLLQRVRAEPEAFAAIARSASDDIYGRQVGGRQPATPVDQLPEALRPALMSGAEPALVETSHGFYVVKRHPLEAAVDVSAATILISWSGLDPLHPPRAARTQAQAVALAASVRQRAVAEPQLFTHLVEQDSDDDVLVQQAGWEGSWSTHESPPPKDAVLTFTVLGLRIGEISEPFETPYGLMIARRQAPMTTVAMSAVELGVAWSGSRFSSPEVTRTKDEALALATALKAELAAHPERAAALVAAHSDLPSARNAGHRDWVLGRLHPAIDRAVEAVGIGQVAGPVETAVGFHVLLREAPPRS